MLTNLPTALFLLVTTLTLPIYAGIQQSDFSGIGHIYVLASNDWSTATPNNTVGCLDDSGKFVADDGSNKCGTFSRLEDYPYTLSSKEGNCTFEDSTQEENTDSYYGKSDYAWHCKSKHKSDIYDELYTINGFPYVFLCFGDIACFYDAKRTPTGIEAQSLWQFRWGSQQMGITPGHIMLQLMWEKIGELPKRGDTSGVPGPRIELRKGQQVPLLGKSAKA